MRKLLYSCVVGKPSAGKKRMYNQNKVLAALRITIKMQYVIDTVIRILLTKLSPTAQETLAEMEEYRQRKGKPSNSCRCRSYVDLEQKGGVAEDGLEEGRDALGPIEGTPGWTPILG